MKFKIICTDKEFEHEVSVKNISYFGKPGKISELYLQIEQLLTLNRKNFEYHIDYFKETIHIESTHAKFLSHLRENRLSNLLDIELV